MFVSLGHDSTDHLVKPAPCLSPSVACCDTSSLAGAVPALLPAGPGHYGVVMLINSRQYSADDLVKDEMIAEESDRSRVHCVQHYKVLGFSCKLFEPRCHRQDQHVDQLLVNIGAMLQVGWTGRQA